MSDPMQAREMAGRLKTDWFAMSDWRGEVYDSRKIAIMLESLAEQVERLTNQLAVVHEHRIKTEKKYNERVTHGFNDGFTMQLQSEATLLTMVCRESAGKELAERLVSLESQLTAVTKDLEFYKQYAGKQIIASDFQDADQMRRALEIKTAELTIAKELLRDLLAWIDRYVPIDKSYWRTRINTLLSETITNEAEQQSNTL